MTRLHATPADVVSLLIDSMERDCRERHPGAFAPPEDGRPDPEAMPDHEMAVRRAMLALDDLEQLDHAGRAEQWERILAAVHEAADAEWKLWRKWGTRA